jgi:hypothetical protein
MNKDLENYYDSEAPRLAEEYLLEEPLRLKRFVLNLMERDIINQDDMQDFCEEPNDIIDYHKFIKENFKHDSEELEGIAYESWKEEKNN